jgi:hypothetical protein
MRPFAARAAPEHVCMVAAVLLHPLLQLFAA